MSASDKKKLRAAERAEKLTERQLAEQKEAKKLKLFTTIFAVVLALMVCFAVYIGVTKTIEGSGVREKNTVALTIGDHEISNAELNYYFIDSVNQFYRQYGSYASLLGLDTTKPLDKQILDEANGTTWADDFLTSAIANAKAVYAMNDAAAAEGFTMTEELQKALDESMSTAEFYAMYNYGYPDLETFLKNMYGYGATVEGYREYYKMTLLADAYIAHYTRNLEYEDADLREAEAENYNAYSHYTYNYYYLDARNFLEVEDKSTYTPEQYVAAVNAAEEAAKALTGEDITDVASLDAAIAALPVNKEIENVGSIASAEVSYSGLNTLYADWITDSSRKAGDVHYFAKTSTTTDDSGNESTKTDGFYVVMFNSCNDNNFPLVNVRHILAAFKGGTVDSSTGLTTYSDEEKATAKATAEEIYNEWKSGAATEDSFAALANEKSDDGDGTTGGLYEDVYPGLMVPAFNDWCFSDNRKPGDTEIVETEYGYHIMYFSGESNVLYRDFMIENDLKNADVSEWHANLVDAVTETVKDTQYLSTDLVLSAG